MTWFLRKSFRFGPLRLNLSKRGVGASVGVTGARLGVDATGKPYAAGGRYGLYFRKRLGPGRSGRPGAAHAPLVAARRPRSADRPPRGRLARACRRPGARGSVRRFGTPHWVRRRGPGHGPCRLLRRPEPAHGLGARGRDGPRGAFRARRHETGANGTPRVPAAKEGATSMIRNVLTKRSIVLLALVVVVVLIVLIASR